MAAEWPPGLEPSLLLMGKFPLRTWGWSWKTPLSFLKFLVFYKTPGVFPFAQNPTVFPAIYDVAFGPLSLVP